VWSTDRIGGFLFQHGIMKSMKSILGILSVCITISIACSGSRSASSPSFTTNNMSAAQASSPLANSLTQEKPTCDLTMTQQPGIKGLKLGMTVEEVLAVFPGSKTDAEVTSAISRPPSAVGTSSFVIRPMKYPNQPEFAAVSQIAFTLLDGRVSNFTVNYSSPQYAHIDKFIEVIIRGTSLPAADRWQPYAGLDEQMKTLTCTDFSVRAFIGGEGGSQNYVLFQDLEADKIVKERRKKAREQASPTPGK
jgi:hypothetical protein